MPHPPIPCHPRFVHVKAQARINNKSGAIEETPAHDSFAISTKPYLYVNIELLEGDDLEHCGSIARCTWLDEAYAMTEDTQVHLYYRATENASAWREWSKERNKS